MAYGDRPFGLRNVTLVPLNGGPRVQLPAAMTFSFSERVISAEMGGDDKLSAVATLPDAVEWELEAGGISQEAYALMTGRTVAQAGTTPDLVYTLTGSAQEAYPYFKVYGQAIDEASGDFHCKLYKCKLTSGMKGQLIHGAFWQSGVSGIAMDDGTNGIWDWVQNETATALLPAYFPGFRAGLELSYVDDDTLAVAAGVVELAENFYAFSAGTVTFADLDTGARALGRDYAVFATPDGIKLSLIPVDNSGTGVLAPSGYTAATARLLGYFHNGVKADGTVGASRNQAIFEYSVTNNDLLNESHPYRAHQDLAAGVPLPGMVKVGGVAVGIYQASREDATASAAGSSAYPTSRYGVVPWASVTGWDTMAVLANAGCKMPTWAEWLESVEFNPGSSAPARANGNSNSGASSDDATQSGAADPTQAGRTLTGTGPRTTNNGATAAGRSWYSPAGISDPVGNVWEWVATFFGGLKATSPGTGVAWGYEGDYAYNFEGQAYNTDTGGYTSGLPALLSVGGDWADTANAGVRAADAGNSPGNSGVTIGMRVAR